LGNAVCAFDLVENPLPDGLEAQTAITLNINGVGYIGRWSDVKEHTFRVAAAVAGASAVVAMGVLSVAVRATQAQANTVIPEHFGGPVYTSIYSPTATLGMPTLSSSSTDAPTPMSAPG
jgi:hypothetical protein